MFHGQTNLVSGRLDTYQRTTPEVSGKRWRGAVGSYLWILGVPSLKLTIRTWKMDGWKRWTRPIYKGNVLVSGIVVSFLFVVFFVGLLQTNFHQLWHWRASPKVPFWTSQRCLFSASIRGKAALKPTLEVGQDGGGNPGGVMASMAPDVGLSAINLWMFGDVSRGPIFFHWGYVVFGGLSLFLHTKTNT